MEGTKIVVEALLLCRNQSVVSRQQLSERVGTLPNILPFVRGVSPLLLLIK